MANMITKNFSQLSQHELGVVIRCVAAGHANKIPYIIAGCIDSNLYILDKDCTPLQKVTFGNWVRCCAMGDIDGDGDDEIVAGSGDKSLKILKLIGERFQEIRSIDFPHIVNACAIADVKGDGIPEILVGTWGEIVYALDPREYKILWQKEFRGWINFICPGDVTGSGRTDLLVGTRDGLFYVVEGTDGHVIWDYTFPKEINGAAIADVDNSGVPSILVGGNTEVLTIFNSQGNIQRELPVQNRILSIAVGDIDGDHANEIILGCSDNTLRVMENRTHSLEGISFKWRGKFENTIRGIQILDLLGNGVNHIIFGGYNKVIQAIQDFQWGKKPAIETIPVPLAVGTTAATALEAQQFILEKIEHIEDLLANSPEELAEIRAQKPKPEIHSPSGEPQTSPHNLLNNIITGKDAAAAEEARRIPRAPSLLAPKNIPEVEQPVKTPEVVPSIQQTPQPVVAPTVELISHPEKQGGTAPLTLYCEQAIEHLKKAGVISSKAKLAEAVSALGIPAEAVENVITTLLDGQQLVYSRTAPRGYSSVSGTPGTPVQVVVAVKQVKPAKKAAKKAAKKVAKKVAKKATKKSAKKAAKKVTEVPAVVPTPAVGVPIVEKAVATEATGDVNTEITRAYDILKTKGLIPSKPELAKILQDTGVPANLIEAIINNLKENGRLTYSRAAPRGYTAV